MSWSSEQETTSATTLESFRLGSALRTDMPPQVCNLSVRLSTSLHLNTSLQSAIHRPPTAKSRIGVDVNLNLTYHNIAWVVFGTNVTSTTPGGPRHLTTLTDASTTRNARDLRIVQSSYLAACIAECQLHHVFISMQASRIRNLIPRVLYSTPLPHLHCTCENGE
jgi:hypothetical protein